MAMFGEQSEVWHRILGLDAKVDESRVKFDANAVFISENYDSIYMALSGFGGKS